VSRASSRHNADGLYGFFTNTERVTGGAKVDGE
jgi:hypothetical protein